MHQILLLFLLLVICEKSTAQAGESSSITLDQGVVLLETWVDDTPQKMMLSFIGNSYRFSNHVSSKLQQVVIRSGIISNRQYSLENASAVCHDRYGIIGGDILKHNSDAYLLDFDLNTLSVIDAGDQSSYKLEGFKEIKSIFYRDKIEIVVNIGWKDYKFALDFTYDGVFSHQFDKLLAEKVGEGYSYISLSHLRAKERDYNVYPFAKVYLNKVGYSGSLTMGIVENRVGTGFLKGFNWIIDYRYKKVYYNKNYIPLDTNLLRNEYKTSIIDGKIYISDVKRGSNRYRLGAVIEAIDSKVVTSDNICELQNLLINLTSWSDLSITTNHN